MYALHCKYSVFNNDMQPVKVFQSVSFTDLLIFRFACMGQRIYNVNNQKSLEWMPLHTVSIKCRPQTALVKTVLIGSR